VRAEPVARKRRHTLLFLDEIRAISPVFLGTEVDMTLVQSHRTAAREQGRRPGSVLAYVLYAAARALRAHPSANAAMRGRVSPRVARYPQVHGKITLDKTLNGERVVVSTVLLDLHEAGLAEIQQRIDHFRDGDPATMPEFAAMRLLQRLPRPLGALAFRLGVRPLDRRSAAMGTFAVTSLGHRPVDAFYSVGGTTVTLGLGRMTDRPMVRDGAVTVASVMRLSLTFDHRVIDGAEAADVLADIKDALETRLPEGADDLPVPLEGAR
jgi:pyruvate/2-oxoglutarate dehydrogenase complex dihydrolipoamide acyltransferase (E2) component